jgi:hypothetical protein
MNPNLKLDPVETFFSHVRFNPNAKLNLKALSDEGLMSSTRNTIRVENTATTNVVRHFREIFDRDLYLARGYGSMWLMAVSEFGYDKSSAQRRVNAMELSRAVPEILSKIDSRMMCLQTAADIQTFLNLERAAKRPYSVQQKIDLVETCSGLSVRDVQMELANRNPKIDFKVTKTYVSKDRIRITHTLAVSIEDKLTRIKNLLSHVNPYLTREELIDYMAEKTLDAIDPLRRDQRTAARKLKASDRSCESELSASSQSKMGDTDRSQMKIPIKKLFVPEVFVRDAVEEDATKENVTFTEAIEGDFNMDDLATSALIDPPASVLSKDEVIGEVGEIQLAIVFPELEETSSVPAQALKGPRRSRYVKAENRRVVRRFNNEPYDDACAGKCDGERGNKSIGEANFGGGSRGGCAYVDKQSGRRCGATHQSQFDHIEEYSIGGSSSPDNLQILCAKHNRYRWKTRSSFGVCETQISYG